MTPDWRGPVIVGRGGYTAVGVTMLSSAAAVRARVSMAQEHPFMVDKLGDPMIVAAVPVLDPHLSGTRRLLSLALPAAAEALAPIAHLTQSPPVTVVVGLPEPRPGLPGQLEIKLREGLDKALSAEVRITAIETAATGHAGGLLAIRRACELLTTGKATFCLAGGVDSWIDPTTLAWLDSIGRLHSETTSWGFCPGEAAGFCLICSVSEAKKLDLTTYASVLSIISTIEPNRIMTDTVCIAEGLTAACRGALSSLPGGTLVDYVICDLNGEPYRGDEYGFMMSRLCSRFSDGVGFETPAQSWGDIGASSGPLFLNLASLACQKGYSLGPLNLLYAGSDSGRRCAALISAFGARQ